MALYSSNIKIDLTVRKYAQKGLEYPTRATGTTPQMELVKETKTFDLSIKGALQLLIDLMTHW